MAELPIVMGPRANAKARRGRRRAELAVQIDALIPALNRSAERIQTLWISFILFMLYLAVACGTTTHRMLLLGSTIKLPILGIDLPLLGFYIISPLILFAMHIYLLAQLVMLSRRAGDLNDLFADLRKNAEKDKRSDAEEGRRNLLETTPFLQMIAGPERDGSSAVGSLLRSIAYLSMTLAPALLLMLHQERFLPYHSVGITWWHRFWVVADIVVAGFLWASFRYGRGIHYRWWHRASTSAFSVTLLATGLFATLYLGSWRLEPILGHNRAPWLEASLAQAGIYRRSLELTDERFVDAEALAKLVAAGRGSDPLSDLWAPMPGLDFTGRDLSDAQFRNADLRNARFNRTDIRGSDFRDAWLSGSRFENVDARRANFNSTIMQQVSINNSRFAGARMEGVDLKGANISGSSFHGALISGADLSFSSIVSSTFTASSLANTRLNGSYILDTQFWAADLRQINIAGSDIFAAGFIGADLTGAVLDSVSIRSSDFFDSLATDVRANGIWRENNVISRPDGIFHIRDATTNDVSSTGDLLFAEDVASAIEASVRELLQLPDDEYAGIFVRDRIKILRQTVRALEAPSLRSWQPILNENNNEVEFSGAWVTSTVNLFCRAGLPNVARSFIVRSALTMKGEEFGASGFSLSQRFRNVWEKLVEHRNAKEQGCIGVRGLSTEEWDRFEKAVSIAITRDVRGFSIQSEGGL